MHAISSYRGNKPTNKQTHRQDRLQYATPQLARNVMIRLLLYAAKDVETLQAFHSNSKTVSLSQILINYGMHDNP